MKAILAFTILFLGITRTNAQEIVFDLSLNKQDSTITYKVVNYTGVKLMVAKSIIGLDNTIKGSYCAIRYKNQQNKELYDFLPVSKKYFSLKPNESYSYQVNISTYMKSQPISVEGILSVGYHLSGEFNMRMEDLRRTIRF